MPCKFTQNRWVLMEGLDEMWSIGKGNGKPLQHSCLENVMNSMKRQQDMTLKDQLLRLIAALSTTREEQKNSSIRNEEAELKQKQCPVVDVSDGESKV